MNLILTMAGTYERFKKEGFMIPKYFLPWEDKNILSKILYEFLYKSNDFKFILLITNKIDHKYLVHIKSCLKKINFENYHILEISTSSGQAETAKIGIDYLSSNPSLAKNPVVFHNIDTLLHGRDFSKINDDLVMYDGHIDVFKSANPEYSYVLLNNDNFVEEIVEKIVVSDYATSGLYGFKDYTIFLDYYENHHKYISEIYSAMILKGKKIKASINFSEDQTIVLGTPDEYFQKTKLLP